VSSGSGSSNWSRDAASGEWSVNHVRHLPHFHVTGAAVWHFLEKKHTSSSGNTAGNISVVLADLVLTKRVAQELLEDLRVLERLTIYHVHGAGG